MRPILVILFFTSFVLSYASTNRTNSDYSIQLDHIDGRSTRYYYAVVPNRSVGASESATFVEFLRTLSGSKIVSDKNKYGHTSWRVALNEESHVEDIRNYRSWIKSVEPIEENDYRRPPKKEKREAEPIYNVWTKDPTNHDETTATKKWLSSQVLDKNAYISEWKRRKTGNVEVWGMVTLDEAGVERVRNHPGVRSVEKTSLPESTRVAMRADWSKENMVARSLHKHSKRVDLKWNKQESAAEDLVMNSQYKGSQLGKDFVYEERAGKGVTIYVIDQGVQIRVLNDDGDEEFAPYILNEGKKGYQTGHSRESGEDGNADDSRGHAEGHGTPVASIALGKKYGVAKAATLASVKIIDSVSILEGLELILDDVQDNPDPASKSVVLMSMVFREEKFDSPEEARKSDTGAAVTERFGDLMDVGVPVVVSSGNYALLGSPRIDNIPPILEGPDLPLIVVGAATYEGERAAFSQYGDQLSLYAPGTEVLAQMKTDRTSRKADGSSLAAPAVAGVIATYLAYDTPPWDSSKQGKDRVRAIKEYIKSDASSWERKPGIRMIWNGADENAHKDATPVICKRDGQCPTKPSPSPQPSTTPQYSRECNKIENKKYIIEHKISDLINNHFCPAAVSQGKHDDGTQSFARSYNIGTTEEVDLAIDWPSNLQDFKPNMDDCKHYLHDLIRYCDYEFPMAWKAGGNVHFGPVVYRFSTKNVRQYPMPKPWSTCEVIHDQPTSRSPVTLKFNIGGAGWMNSDFGQGMKDGLGNLKSWNFKYELGSDGREWTAKFDVMNGKSVTDVQDLARKVVGDGGFAMHCKLKT
ncbi:peptidase S8/S53 domain-containing protein [Dendryphion nanum]|uniref:Peptidase S8/S53 domain-containing protein n=1 Tax=Dendryphion nanum TaxID=256645 RepID=A0A9P9E6Z7_9PLEO|nr:peptidase S8/S53 domain-containing protein [Dendryphion nanum]